MSMCCFRFPEQQTYMGIFKARVTRNIFVVGLPLLRMISISREKSKATSSSIDSSCQACHSYTGGTLGDVHKSRLLLNTSDQLISF